jgi:hypothetical protein
MTPDLQDRWQATLPPFDGKTIAVCDDLLPSDVLEMLQVITAWLQHRYSTVFQFDDWHEHGGFLTYPTNIDWRTASDCWRDVSSLKASSCDEVYVRTALYSPTYEWLLRFDVGSSDDAWPYLDYTAAANSPAMELIDPVASRWPKHTSVSIAATHFQSRYAG